MRGRSSWQTTIRTAAVLLATGWGIGGIGVGASVAEAGLSFEQRDATVTAEPGQAQVDATFAFENTGEQPVTITRVTTSCGCTAGVPDQRRYEPGESGAIQATLKVGDRQGEYTSRIVVYSDAPDSPATSLTLEAQLPELLTIEPGLLFWRRDEPLKAKRARVTLVDAVEGSKLAVPDLDVDVPFSAMLEPVEGEPRQYDLVVTPQAEAGTDGASSVRIPLELRWAEPAETTQADAATDGAQAKATPKEAAKPTSATDADHTDATSDQPTDAATDEPSTLAAATDGIPTSAAAAEAEATEEASREAAKPALKTQRFTLRTRVLPRPAVSGSEEDQKQQ